MLRKNLRRALDAEAEEISSAVTMRWGFEELSLNIIDCTKSEEQHFVSQHTHVVQYSTRFPSNLINWAHKPQQHTVLGLIIIMGLWTHLTIS